MFIVQIFVFVNHVCHARARASNATDRYIALWEEWSYEGTTLTYKATKSLLIDEQGQVVRAETPIAARLNPSGADRAFALNGAAAWITSAADPAKLTLHTVDANLVLVTTPGRSHRAAAWSCRTTATS